MNVAQAANILSECMRDELRDHAFGDREVFWIKGQVTVATGYFGGHYSVSFCDGSVSFSGADALFLAEYGTEGDIERNDEMGPDRYVDGEIMPGLTLEGVFRELTEED